MERCCAAPSQGLLIRTLLLLVFGQHVLQISHCLLVRPSDHLTADAPFLIRSKQLSGGETFNLSTCAAVQLSLSQPLDQYQIQVQQAPRDGAQEQRCELGAQLLEQEPTAEQVAACDTLALDLQGPGGAPAGMQRASHWLHLHSSCAGTAATLKVVGRAPHSRRELGDLTPLYAPLPNVSSTPSAPAPPPASSSQGSPASGPAPASAPPAAAVACCCGQNNQNGPAAYGQCCCGPVALCCQAAGFCVTQNCTAIFVGSTLIAGALISFMTCGVCIYRARVSMDVPRGGFWDRRHGAQGAPPRQLQLVPVRAPPPGEEGRARECPVCLEETRSNAQWALFPCGHGTCRPCYGRLVAKPQQDAACPLCRAPLKEPVPVAPPAGVVVVPSEPAMPLGGAQPAQMTSYVAQPPAAYTSPGMQGSRAEPSSY